jgi:hypothetical protein
MELDLRRLRGADRLVGAGAVALLVFMFFFDWFGESVSGTLPGSDVGGAGFSATGWDTFTNSRWVWLLTSAVAIASVAAIAVQRRLPSTLPPGAIVMLLGFLSVVLILYRIVHHPAATAHFAGFHASYGIRTGIWLGLIAALAIAVGGCLQLRAEGAPTPPAAEPAKGTFSGLTVPGADVVDQAPREEQSPPAVETPADDDRRSPTPDA